MEKYQIDARREVILFSFFIGDWKCLDSASTSISASRGKLQPGVQALALSYPHPGLFIVVPNSARTLSPRGWDKPHVQVREEAGAQLYPHAHPPRTSCNSAKFHKCAVTQWLHLGAISVKSTALM